MVEFKEEASNIKLVEDNKIKQILYLKFSGICGNGSGGNKDADHIISVSKSKICEYENVQGLILDFSDMTYKFGNRFLNLIPPNSIVPDKTILTSIIVKKENLNYWKSLVEFGGVNIDFYGNPSSIFQENISDGITSINKRFN